MIVSEENFHEVLGVLLGEEKLSLDTETTGLLSWKGDRLFSIVVGTKDAAYYFNFQPYEGLEEKYVLSRERIRELSSIWKDPSKTIYLHNAKFDLSILDKEEPIAELSKIHDTEVGARLEFNDHQKYDLSSCAERIGESKSDAVEEYIKEKKLVDSKPIPGKKGRSRNKRFDKVPFPIISEYGLQDARVTFKLGEYQEKVIKRFDEDAPKNPNARTLGSLLEVERKLTPVLFSMEKAGIKINPSYCVQAIASEDARARRAESQFLKIVGMPFKDSNVHLAKAFSSLNIAAKSTALGNPSFTDAVLKTIDHEAARVVQEYRDAAKRANTYFRAFLFHADENSVIHTNLRQSGTRTGRLSCKEPNLQNLSKDEEEGLVYPVRKAFVPREDYYFCMIDYDQMEFRMMLDYAAQLDLIEKIRDHGHDPHQATADMTGLTRYAAKTLNFALLYGMGIDKLAKALKCPIDEARLFRKKYFSNLPRVRELLQSVQIKAQNIGFIRAWSGRAFYFNDIKFCYKAPNALIQGGCADVVKEAMINLYEFLRPYKSRMLMQIHDEILFEIHRSEIGIEVELKKIMESIFPYRQLPLTCSVSHSFKSWGDKEDGIPVAFLDAGRNQIQDESPGSFIGASFPNQTSMVH